MTDALRPALIDLLAAWGQRVRDNREQVDRVREVPDGADFYAPVAAQFRADPHRTDDAALDILRGMAKPDEVWLDIGAGGGRYALPLGLQVREVIALDPSSGMLDVLREGMVEHGINNVRIINARWPPPEPPTADVALISHVSYDIEEIGPFLDAMEDAARSRCVAVLLDRQPPSASDPFWPDVHGEARVTLPALPEFLALLLARGRLFDVRLLDRPPQTFTDPEQAVALVRRQTWVQPGSQKDRVLRQIVAERLTERDGWYALSWEPARLGVVIWAPRQTPLVPAPLRG